MPDPGYFLTPQQWAAIQSALKWIKGFKVTGRGKLVRTGDSCSIYIPPAPGSARGGQPDRRWAWVRVQEAASGAGKYYGVVLGPPETIATETGAVSQADFGSVAEDAEQVLILNSADRGTNAHDLTTGIVHVTDFPAMFIGTNADGERVYLICSYDWKNCNQG